MDLLIVLSFSDRFVFHPIKCFVSSVAIGFQQKVQVYAHHGANGCLQYIWVSKWSETISKWLILYIRLVLGGMYKLNGCERFKAFLRLRPIVLGSYQCAFATGATCLYYVPAHLPRCLDNKWYCARIGVSVILRQVVWFSAKLKFCLFQRPSVPSAADWKNTWLKVNCANWTQSDWSF